jgi:AcrR family transcriptional regulator
MSISKAVEAVRKRVTKKPEERRQDIMDAALHAFLEKGIPTTTVADITEAAGVAKGTFYLYFDSKEALLGALKERFIDDLITHAASFAARIGQDDWWALAEATAEGWVDFSLGHADLIKLFAQEGLKPDTYQPFADCEQKIEAMMVAGIQAGIAAGAFSVTDPELTVRLLSHAIEGTIEHAILFGPDVDRERLVASAKELIRKVLAPQPAPSA